VQFNQTDILITSYNTLAYDLKKWEDGMDPASKMKKQKVKAGSNLSIFDVAFHRVVLDEAHIIRSSSTGFFKAVSKLQTKYRLCLTGTPFVNRPSDMHSLLAFLRLEPLNNRAVFDRVVTRRIKARDSRGLATVRTTMAYVALRRTKAQVHSTIKLVSKTVEDRILDFPDGIHKDIHDKLYMAAKAVFLGFLRQQNEDGIIGNYMQFLVLILRVRQACCHAGLVPADYIENAEHVLGMVNKQSGELPPDLAEDLLAVLQGTFQKEQLEECAVCRNELEEESAMILRECKHIFCDACLSNIRNQVCPMCRLPYGPDDMISKKIAEASSKTAQPDVKNATRDVKNAMKLGRSPKIQALLDLIDEMAPDEKGVIFSQWTSFLDIIETALAKDGHTYTRVDGTMSADRRGQAMEDFDTEGCNSMKTPRFIICSLMACGT
jgi:SWI/SNF-related matrix-associated actin-dependent regulator of chromatin subfamily A3